MKVFKFGGASIKSAMAVRNMGSILEMYPDDRLFVVVSAMGKTTNALEIIYNKAHKGVDCQTDIKSLFEYHLEIGKDLFGSMEQASKIIKPLIDELTLRLQEDARTRDYDEGYDSIIPFGELLSSKIVFHYLDSTGKKIKLLDARDVVITDERFRDAGVQWDKTCQKINGSVDPVVEGQMWITQGFIGKSAGGKMTTLGREGSDYTASVLASCLSAESVTIWKDVPGILNADPKRMKDTRLYPNLSYQEAAEMSYYGASVIHPKTIKPLANKGIPLFVKSFENPELPGTVIDAGQVHSLPPNFVFKDHQCLISFTRRDLEFINEKNLSRIFEFLDKLNLKINLMQNSAVSFSICINFEEDKVQQLVLNTENEFKVLYNTGLQLVTIKNYTPGAIDLVCHEKEILLEQRTRNTFQIITRTGQV